MKEACDRFLIPGILGLVLFLLVVYSGRILRNEYGSDWTSVERIRRIGKIRMITTYALDAYYEDTGRPAGFEYELAKAFADFMDVELEVVVPGWNHLFTHLTKEKGDFIASGLVINREGLAKVNYSIPYMTVQQHVIHHELVFGPRNIEDLTYRTLHVRRGSSYHSRLKELKESGIPLNFILHDNVPAEELIRMVHDREIRFTAASNTVALLCRRYYPDIRIGIAIQENEPLAWAVRKDDPEMLEEINKFFLFARESGLLKRISDKYYSGIKHSDPFDIKKFHQRIDTRLPEFKPLIMQESEKYGFDWKLIAAIIYQESHFNPDATSFTNVRGLMQVTEMAAQDMGIFNRVNPEQSIRAGIRYFDRMMEKFDYLDDEYEKILFALASYNVGYGHVLDAVKIARDLGMDPGRWQSLKTTLPLLSEARYHTKTRHGYARGWEPVHYVERILTYYDILKKKESRTVSDKGG